MGPVQSEGSEIYLRPETAQGMFVDFKNVLQSVRKKPPFGIAQVGKSFRNEITPGNFVFRTREFEQMEMEYFVPPAEVGDWYEYWKNERFDWYKRLGVRPDKLRLREHDADESSHYSSGTADVEYEFPFGWGELEGIANRGVIARRVARELEAGSAVNLGFGISANVPRILLEEGLHGDVTWVIEQGAVGGVPLLDFAFGCASNADAFMPSPYQFTYFQGAGFDASLLSFLEIDRSGSVNVSKLSFRPHVTAGAGGFVDITARAKKIVFSGMFNAGAKLAVADGKLVHREGRQAEEAGQRGRARHLLGPARRRAGPGHHLCHRARRHEADAARVSCSPRSRPASTCRRIFSTSPNSR